MTWDACSKNVGGAEAAAWEALLEMEKVDLEAGQNGAGGVSLVVDLAKVFGNGSPQRIFFILCGYFAQQRRLRFGKHGVVTSADSHGDSSRIKVVGASFQDCDGRTHDHSLCSVPRSESSGLC